MRWHGPCWFLAVMKTLWGTVALTLTVAAGPRAAAAAEPVDITLQPPPEVRSLRLRLEGDTADAFACSGPCELQVPPGRYQLAITDDHGESRPRSLDLLASESIAVTPPRHRLVTTGAVLAASGVVIAGVSGAVLSYGIVKGFDAWARGCDSGCDTLSQRTIIASATVFSVGVAVGVIGAVLALIGSRPTITEHAASAR